MTNYAYYDSYLYHHGVQGQKWGKRQYQYEDGSLTPEGRVHYGYGQPRDRVKALKSEYKKARKNAEASKNMYSVDKFWLKGRAGRANQENLEKSRNKYLDDQYKSVKANVDYRVSKSKNQKRADKVEFNTYRNEMTKTGLSGSINDYNSGGRSSYLYDKIAAEKGKAYADKIEKSIENRSIAIIAGGTALLVGSTIVEAYLNSR